MRTTFTAIGAIAALAASACSQATTGAQKPQTATATPPPPSAECVIGNGNPNGPGVVIFWFDQASLAVGESIALEPKLVHGSHYWEDLEPACLRDITISPADRATVTRGEDEVTITPTMSLEPDGNVFTVTARYNGRSVEGQFAVYDPREAPLIGSWRQTAEACPQGNALRELIFRPNGSFAATFRPFERYQDYWGSYSFDTATGTLTLEPSGGNYIPGDVADGLVTFRDGHMRAVGASFGSMRDGTRCTADFERVR